MNGPVEPSANIRQFANGMRGMYVALVAEGFTVAEAMQIIGTTISASMNGES